VILRTIIPLRVCYDSGHYQERLHWKLSISSEVLLDRDIFRRGDIENHNFQSSWL
jgi:hypothetical protein